MRFFPVGFLPVRLFPVRLFPVRFFPRTIYIYTVNANVQSSNARLLACDTANENALERHVAAVRQLFNGTNGTYSNSRDTIQTVNSLMRIYESSW